MLGNKSFLGTSFMVPSLLFIWGFVFALFRSLIKERCLLVLLHNGIFLGLSLG